jgi:hypothetical protein
VVFLRRHADRDGTLLDVTTGTREQFAAEWADDLAAVRTKVSGLTVDELRALRARLDRLPRFGHRRGVMRTDGGWTLRWSEPRQAADGKWCVECPPFDAGGGSVPVWPPGPLDVR